MLMVQACSSKPKPAKSNSKQLVQQFIGEWQSLELEVRINTVAGIEDSFFVLKISEDEWLSKHQMLPIRTVFNPDQSYYSEYRGADSLISQRSSGFFEVKGDSLIIHRTEPSLETLYHTWVRKNDSIYGFQSVLDYDGDGQADDEFFSLNLRTAL